MSKIQEVVLGTLINGFTGNIDLVREEYFLSREHKFFFKIIKRLIERQEPVDMLEVEKWASKKGDFMKEIAEVTTYGNHRDISISEVEDLKTHFIQIEFNRITDDCNKGILTFHEAFSSLKYLKELEEAELGEDLDGFSDGSHYESIVDDAQFIPTGIEELDQLLNDLKCEDLSVVAGNRGEGKTTFVNQTALNAIEHGFPTMFINGEFTTKTLLNNLYTMMIGLDTDYYENVLYNKKYVKEPTQEALKALQSWHKNKLFIYSKSDGKLRTHDQLFRLLEKKIVKHGLKLVVVDNLMSLLTIESSSEKNDAQADFIKRLVSLGHRYKCHIMLVVHPNKGADKGKAFSANLISGTGDIGNNAANIIMIVREYDKEKIKKKIHGHAIIDKNRHWGIEKSIDLFYDQKRRAYCGFNEEGMPVAIVPNWKRFLPKKIKNWNGTEQEFGKGEIG